MNETKKKVFLKIAALMAVIMMLTTCIVAGTMAKYTSSGSVTLDADAASWSIKVSEKEVTELSTQSFTFTIFDTDGNSSETDVTSGKIAPGTWGYAEIVVENAGEVTANIKADFAKYSTGDGLPEGMKVTVLQQDTAPTTSTDISSEAETVTATNVAPSSSVKFYIAFVWTFEGNDTEDTEYGLGTQSFDNLGTLTITADQVD